MKNLIRPFIFISLLSSQAPAQFQTLETPAAGETITTLETPEQNSFAFQVQVHFRSGQAQISDEARFEFATHLRNQIESYRQQLEYDGMDLEAGAISVKQVVIKSRTDAKGSEATNMAISEKRALSLVGEVEQIFVAQDISYNPEEITAVGLGESEANEEACKTEQLYCSLGNIKFLEEPKVETTWMTAALNFVSELILPTSHARGNRRTLMDLLFGNDEQENPPPPVYNEPIPSREFQEDPWGEYLYDETPDSCARITWDEMCLDSQRVTTIDIVLEFGEKLATIATPDLVGVDGQPATNSTVVEDRPATQEEVVGEPTENPTVTPTEPVEEPAPVAPLKVYGNPL